MASENDADPALPATETDMDLTRDQLLTIMPNAGAHVDEFLPFIVSTMERWEINTSARAAAFLAQIAHESGELRWVKELASGKEYDGRKDMGNDDLDGHEDGVFFKGRGLIQITGRNNYRDCSMGLFGNFQLLETPEILQQPEWACQSAGWFWKTNGLNELADKADFERITRRINGGLNGLDARVTYWHRAIQALII